MYVVHVCVCLCMCTCMCVCILCNSFTRTVLVLYVCPFCAAVLPGWCSHCTCIHLVQQFFRMVLTLDMWTCVHSVQQFFQDGAHIIDVYILCSSFTRTVLALYVCPFCAAVLPGRCSHWGCLPQVFPSCWSGTKRRQCGSHHLPCQCYTILRL